jgi:putative ABC transport system permease protein
MIDLALKSVMSQKTRTFLTMLGILIGITAIVSLGSIADGIDASIQSNFELTAGKITVEDKEATGMFGFGGSLDANDLEIISGLPGVKDAYPILVQIEFSGVGFGPPSMIIVGINPEDTEVITGKKIGMESGEPIEEGDGFVAMVGYDVGIQNGWEPGDYFTYRDTDFEITGVIEKTNIQNIDESVIVPLDALQEVLNKDTYQSIYVVPDDVGDIERVADEINDADERYSASTSTDAARQAETITGQIRIFTFGIGAIAAFVGGLGVMNTMIMSVMERKREIGLMKAIGATRRVILQQILTESALISVMGGLGGLLIGMVIAGFMGIFGRGFVAMVSPGLAATAMLFALFLGLVGGFYPANKASKLDPVDALRNR